MMTLREAAEDFLAQRRIAVVGVSRDSRQPANFVYRKLRAAGHTVFAVNPHAEEIEGAPCYPNLASAPGGLDAAIVFTPPAASAAVVRECAELGIARVWLHRSLGAGSFSSEAVAIAREHKLRLIPGGCPAMFCAHADLPHRCMRWLLDLTGRLPRQIEHRGT